MLACSHQSPFQEDHCCLLFLPPSLFPFFLQQNSQLQFNRKHLQLSFVVSRDFKSVNAFGSQVFWATILLQTASQMEPICDSSERDQTCTHTKQAPLFCPRKTRLRRLEPLEFSITVKRGFQWVEERTWEVHRFFSLSYSFTHS
jgi:hypothetical protein